MFSLCNRLRNEDKRASFFRHKYRFVYGYVELVSTLFTLENTYWRQSCFRDIRFVQELRLSLATYRGEDVCRLWKKLDRCFTPHLRQNAIYRDGQMFRNGLVTGKQKVERILVYYKRFHYFHSILDTLSSIFQWRH